MLPWRASLPAYHTCAWRSTLTTLDAAVSFPAGQSLARIFRFRTDSERRTCSMGLRGCLPAWTCSLACAFSCSRRSASICTSGQSLTVPQMHHSLQIEFHMHLFAYTVRCKRQDACSNSARSQDEQRGMHQAYLPLLCLQASTQSC